MVVLDPYQLSLEPQGLALGGEGSSTKQPLLATNTRRRRRKRERRRRRKCKGGVGGRENIGEGRVSEKTLEEVEEDNDKEKEEKEEREKGSG
ncbi:hypothetical protein PoB_000411400 [Plakobranchus ocellatus]|uniref:Uncharacterized protein n=1 Tax=Plakobranchus ocellatus TaxID=259542 RepID=A0AAV3Y3Q2_9GAST|nr:hypothetical protein PoB_000411400 [Plakobranchus ocellatus]